MESSFPISASVDRVSIHLCMDCADRNRDEIGNCLQHVDPDDMPCGTISGTVRIYINGILQRTKEAVTPWERSACSSLATHVYTLRGNADD